MIRRGAAWLLALCGSGCQPLPDHAQDYLPELEAVWEAAEGIPGGRHDCSLVPLYVLEPDEIEDECGRRGVDGCTKTGTFSKWIAIEHSPDPYERAQIAMHEYGHCITGHRDHDALLCGVLAVAWDQRFPSRVPPLGTTSNGPEGCL